MKKYRYFLTGIILAGMLFSSCNKIKEGLNVKFNVNYENSMNFNVPDGSRTMTFSKSVNIDPFSSSVFEKHYDQIKKIEIVSLSAEVTSVTKEVDVISTTVNVSNDNRSAQWTLENIPLKVGTVFDLNNDNGQWNVITEIMKDKNVFTEKVEGEVSEGGVQFKLKVRIKTKITVNAM